MNHVDTSQLKDCGEVISLDIDNKSCCGRQMFVSDDKLEAVEQPVLSLFCMNASQSTIISLWRSGPV